MKKILIPTDFSDSSSLVLDYVKNTYCTNVTTLSEIHLLNIITEPVYLGFEGIPITVPPGWVDEVKASSRAKLDTYKSLLPTSIKIITDVRIAHDSIHEEILSYASSVNSDLIILGTHGRNAVERFILGSVAEKLLRTSNIPILAVPPKLK